MRNSTHADTPTERRPHTLTHRRADVQTHRRKCSQARAHFLAECLSVCRPSCLRVCLSTRVCVSSSAMCKQKHRHAHTNGQHVRTYSQPARQTQVDKHTDAHWHIAELIDRCTSRHARAESAVSVLTGAPPSCLRSETTTSCSRAEVQTL